MKPFLIFYFIYLFISSFNVSASVVLNEVAIQPSQVVELYNNASESADISSWYIDDAGGTTYFTIPPQTILPPQSCILFSADFNFNKSSADVVRLFNNASPPTTSSAKLMESYSYSKAPDTNYSFSKTLDGGFEWQTSSSSLGLSNTSLTSCIPTPSPTFIPTPTPTETPLPTPTNSPSPTNIPTPTPSLDYQNIYISEVFPYPDSGEQEWVEFYNNNSFQVQLMDWYIDDSENGGSTPKKFSLTIESYAYGSIAFSSSLFNNDGDSVRLLNNNTVEIDSMEYGKIAKGISIARISFTEDSYCEQEPSRNSANTSCLREPTLSIPTQIPQTSTKVSQKIPAQTKTSTVKTPFKTNTFITSPLISMSPQEGEVLGINIQHEQPPSPSRYLSFVSSSYSLLTIVSIFIKMRNA